MEAKRWEKNTQILEEGRGNGRRGERGEGITTGIDKNSERLRCDVIFSWHVYYTARYVMNVILEVPL